MSEDTQKPASASPDGGSPSEPHAEAKAAPERSESRSAPEPQFDHAKAWNEAFNKLAAIPESILDALEERASSRKKEEKQPEEKAVHQEQPAAPANPNEAPPTPGPKSHSNASAKKPWGHRWLGA